MYNIVAAIPFWYKFHEPYAYDVKGGFRDCTPMDIKTIAPMDKIIALLFWYN